MVRMGLVGVGMVLLSVAVLAEQPAEQGRGSSTIGGIVGERERPEAINRMLRERLGSRTGLCGTYGDHVRIEHLLDEHESGASDASLTLWTLLTAEIWFQSVFQGRDS